MRRYRFIVLGSVGGEFYKSFTSRARRPAVSISSRRVPSSGRRGGRALQTGASDRSGPSWIPCPPVRTVRNRRRSSRRNFSAPWCHSTRGWGGHSAKWVEIDRVRIGGECLVLLVHRARPIDDLIQPGAIPGRRFQHALVVDGRDAPDDGLNRAAVNGALGELPGSELLGMHWAAKRRERQRQSQRGPEEFVFHKEGEMGPLAPAPGTARIPRARATSDRATCPCCRTAASR